MDLPTEAGGPSSAGQHTRRDVIRRAAILSGTAVWAAPAMQQVGMRAAAAVSPPPPAPPPPSPPSEFYGISFVAFVFRCGSTLYKAKYDAERGQWEDVESGDNTKGLATCDQIDKWAEAAPLPSPYDAPPGKGAIDASPVTVGGEVFEVTFTLPASCTFSDGSVAVKGGPDVGGDNGCSYPQVQDGRAFTFVARAKA